MGIPGLTRFMKKKFLGWDHVDLKALDCVIIDGSNVCCTLYQLYHSWGLGGDHAEFYHTVYKFFSDANFKKPIVVFDGICGEDKARKLRQRRRLSIQELRDVQNEVDWDPNKLTCTSTLPHLIFPVFIEVLKARGIEFHEADGEADGEIAALANYHKCPVLASDSDYFLFNLEYGFVHFDHYCKNLEAKLFYKLSEFKKQYSLKQYELLLVIPSIFGNDYLETYKKHTLEDYEKVFTQLAKYDTCEQYFKSGKVAITKETYLAQKERYSNIQLPKFASRKTNITQDPPGLPEWVRLALKQREFPAYLLLAHNKRTYILPRMVESIQHDSAWKASRGIRQYLYGFMGIAEVTECLRGDRVPKLVTEVVQSKSLTEPVSVKDSFFLEKDTEKLADLVFCILKCHKISPEDQRDIFDTLPDQWKLPIAATFYWYRILDNPPSKRRFVKALLLSFLVCSEEIPDRANPLPMVTIDTKAAHLEALHALAKWLCVYSSALALNDVARQPFRAVSPSCLYSGEVAMRYAIVESPARDRHIVEEKPWELYNRFLYLVTGIDEEGRKGRHEVKNKEHKDSWQVATRPK